MLQEWLLEPQQSAELERSKLIMSNNDYYSKRIQQERAYWTQLKQLASEDKVLEFYQLYSQYLEWNNIYSPDRKAIYKMAKKVVELLSEKNNES